jgi:endonuclease YncB( thermonuclease family)
MKTETTLTFHALCGLLALVFIGQTPAAEWSGTCCAVHDGDTLSVKSDAGKQRIRLYGVDCPELVQPFGCEAIFFTCKAVCGKKVRVIQVDTDVHDRVVAWVWYGDRCLNKELVRAGLAWWFRRYAPSNQELAGLERESRKDKRGLWSATDPIPPWRFRRK